MIRYIEGTQRRILQIRKFEEGERSDMYEIVRKEALRPTVTLYEIKAPLIAKKAPSAQIPTTSEVSSRLSIDCRSLPVSANAICVLSRLSAMR